MLILILLLGAILGGVLSFLAYMVAIEDFLTEDEIGTMNVKQMIGFSLRKMKVDWKFIILSSVSMGVMLMSLLWRYGFGYEF